MQGVQLAVYSGTQFTPYDRYDYYREYIAVWVHSRNFFSFLLIYFIKVLYNLPEIHIPSCKSCQSLHQTRTQESGIVSRILDIFFFLFFFFPHVLLPDCSILFTVNNNHKDISFINVLLFLQPLLHNQLYKPGVTHWTIDENYDSTIFARLGQKTWVKIQFITFGICSHITLIPLINFYLSNDFGENFKWQSN